MQKLAERAGDPDTSSCASAALAGKGAEFEGAITPSLCLRPESEVIPSVLQASKGAEVEGCHDATPVFASWEVTHFICAAGRQARVC